MSTTPDDVYAALKSLEGKFSPQAPYYYLNVGTLDVDNGAFAGLKTEIIDDDEPVEHDPHDQTPHNPPPHFQGATWVSVAIKPHWKGRTVTITPAPHVPLQPVQLVFTLSRPITATWEVSVSGVTVQANPGQTSLSIDIWDASHAGWTIHANGFTYGDALRLQRPPGNLGGALGAFTLPVLPITIIYATPVDSLENSTATYAQGQTIGQTTDLTNSTDTAHTGVGNIPSSLTNVVFLKLFLKEVQLSLLAMPGNPIGLGGLTAEGGANLFSAAADQIGQVSASTTTGFIDQSEMKMTVTTGSNTTLGTTAHAGGPGVGDVIHYYHNLRMAWVYYRGGLRLCPFGGSQALQPVSKIQNSPSEIGLSAEDAASLLALDPFVAGGPAANPLSDRFQYIATWEYGGGDTVHFTNTVTRDTQQTDTQTNYEVDTSSWEAGPILKSLGFGGSDQTTIKLSNATGSDVSSTVTIDALLASGKTDEFVVTVWYDRLFGTFAFQQLQPSNVVRLQGTGAKPGETVSLTAGGRTFNTIADESGAYAFHAPIIPAGAAMLTVSGAAKPVMVEA
jgi:hypothetical protein